MADVIVSFNASPRIGLVVRGKLSATHHPDLMAQHADVILGDGSPIGFYGEGNGGSGNRVGMAMQGIVYDHTAMRINRPYYVDADSAVTNRVVSTVLLVTVTAAQARTFGDSWARMGLQPGSFNIVGGNCSSHASAAFIESGVVRGGIPGMDTPDRLYAQIVRDQPAAALTSLTGFVGFTPAARGGFNLVVKPYVDTPQVARPNPGPLASLSAGRAA